MRFWIAIGLGLGLAPVAPGTVGSLGGLLLVWLLWPLGGSWAVAAGTVAAVAVGLWSSGAGVVRYGPDPGPVVIDEIAGQMLALLFLAPNPAALAVGFVLFRVFDVWKPWPVRPAEKLPGASGIMADDLLAGIYANLVHHALRWGFPGWWGGA